MDRWRCGLVVLARRLAPARDHDEADKRQIRAAVFDEKRAKLFNQYFDKLKGQYKIQINKDALKAAL